MFIIIIILGSFFQVRELQLVLNDSLISEYVEMNFRFADRSFRGGISLGQFLASHAKLLVMHSPQTRQLNARHKEARAAQASPRVPELEKKPSLLGRAPHGR